MSLITLAEGCKGTVFLRNSIARPSPYQSQLDNGNTLLERSLNQHSTQFVFSRVKVQRHKKYKFVIVVFCQQRYILQNVASYQDACEHTRLLTFHLGEVWVVEKYGFKFFLTSLRWIFFCPFFAGRGGKRAEILADLQTTVPTCRSARDRGLKGASGN